MRTAAYDVDAQADLAVPRDALAGLLDWLRARLAAALDESSLPALADDAVERAASQSLLRRGRQRVAVLARRLEGRFALPGWNLEPLRWPTDVTGELVARGPGRARVDVRFTLAARGNRSQVGVDFQPADPRDHDVKAVIDALVALLRETQRAPSPPADAGAAVAS